MLQPASSSSFSRRRATISALSETPQAWIYKISGSAPGLSVSYNSETGKTVRSGGWIDYHISTKF